MAIVNLPATITFVLVDETGSRSEVQTSILAATTVADARTAADALVAELNAASDAVVEGYSITFSSVETEPAAPAAGGRVERKGLLAFRTAAGKIARVTIPGVIGAAVLPSGRLDEDNAAIAAVVASLGATPFSDSNGAALSTLVEAYEVYRDTSRRQKPTDRKPD